LVWSLCIMLSVLGGSSEGNDQSELLSQCAIVSLFANIIAYITFSFLTHSRLIDRIQAEAFVSPADTHSLLDFRSVSKRNYRGFTYYYKQIYRLTAL
jgi:hypothetical protein